MHKGRLYPFHPKFWVGWSYFWPNFLPWKMSLDEGYFEGPGFVAMGDAPFPVFSNPGSYISEHELQWQWPVTWTPLSDLLQLNCLDSIQFGNRYVEWHFQISLAGVQIDEAYQYASSPAPLAENVGAYWYKPSGLPPINFAGQFDLRPTLYSQGGSPWSD